MELIKNQPTENTQFEHIVNMRRVLLELTKNIDALSKKVNAQTGNIGQVQTDLSDDIKNFIYDFHAFSSMPVIANDDELLIYDKSNTIYRRMTVEQFKRSLPSNQSPLVSDFKNHLTLDGSSYTLPLVDNNNNLIYLEY